MFCVQAAGSEVTTVEALGEVDDLHPLQEAFRRHHGLQCGFCTPGFLMSSYDLLRDGAVDEARLREELSGVLCRCTGYAGIVDAVREVAASHPDGLPAPKALGRPILVRGGGVPAAEAAALQHSAERAAAAPSARQRARSTWRCPRASPTRPSTSSPRSTPRPRRRGRCLRTFRR